MFEIIPNWHPVFVHFTVSTLSLASIFYLISYILVIKNKPSHHKTRQFADWNLWLGALFAIITAIAGWQAFNTVAHDTPSHEAMTDHRNWALTTTVIFLVIAIWSIYRKRSNLPVKSFFLLIVLIAFSMLGSAAWRGGEIVYRFGLGVMSLPEVTSGDDGHNHSHDGKGEDDELLRLHEDHENKSQLNSSHAHSANEEGHINHDH